MAKSSHGKQQQQFANHQLYQRTLGESGHFVFKKKFEVLTVLEKWLNNTFTPPSPVQSLKSDSKLLTSCFSTIPYTISAIW